MLHELTASCWGQAAGTAYLQTRSGHGSLRLILGNAACAALAKPTSGHSQPHLMVKLNVKPAPKLSQVTAWLTVYHNYCGISVCHIEIVF